MKLMEDGKVLPVSKCGSYVGVRTTEWCPVFLLESKKHMPYVLHKYLGFFTLGFDRVACKE